MWDQVYYPVLDDTKGLPYGLYVHGNLGTEGATRAVRAIADGLGWKPVAEPLEVTGEPDKDALDACYELAATGGLLYPDDLHVSALAATEDRPGHHLGPVVIEEPDLAHRLQRGQPLRHGPRRPRWFDGS